MENKINNGVRCDGFIDKPVKCDNPIQEKWVHIEAVKKTGEKDNEFVIYHKPVCVERINLDKQIAKEAIGTDLKSLIAQVLRTGDSTILNQREGSYVDITGYPENTIDAMNNLVRGNSILGELPDDLKSMKLEDLINMSDEDIGSFVKEKISKAVEAAKPAKTEDTASSEPVVPEGGDK